MAYLLLGDIAESHIKYFNDLGFLELDLSKISHSIPCYDQGKPFVYSWLHASDGADVISFSRLLFDENLDNIEARGGYSIIYTHLGKGLYVDGKLNKNFAQRIEALVARGAWITTGSELLRFLAGQCESRRRTAWDRFRVELRWVAEKLYHGPS